MGNVEKPYQPFICLINIFRYYVYLDIFSVKLNHIKHHLCKPVPILPRTILHQKFILPPYFSNFTYFIFFWITQRLLTFNNAIFINFYKKLTVNIIIKLNYAKDPNTIKFNKCTQAIDAVTFMIVFCRPYVGLAPDLQTKR